MNRIVPALVATLALTAAAPVLACTNFLATPGATVDGSVIVTYTCDGEFHPTLRRIPAADHEPGAMEDITDWSGNLMGQVPYPAHLSECATARKHIIDLHGLPHLAHDRVDIIGVVLQQSLHTG